MTSEFQIYNQTHLPKQLSIKCSNLFHSVQFRKLIFRNHFIPVAELSTRNNLRKVKDITECEMESLVFMG